jgi:hypothetical protein
VKPQPTQRSDAASPAYNVEGLALAAAPRPRPEDAGVDPSRKRQDSPRSHLLAQHDGDALPHFQWETKLMASPSAGTNARLRSRPRLTVAHWPGDIEVASQVASNLVANAAEHGIPFHDGTVGLRLTIGPETSALVIEVSDAFAEFPHFEEATSHPDRDHAQFGLESVMHQKVSVSWEELTGDEGEVIGKTVRAIVPADRAEETK